MNIEDSLKERGYEYTRDFNTGDFFLDNVREIQEKVNKEEIKGFVMFPYVDDDGNLLRIHSNHLVVRVYYLK